ncbi:MAG: GNAT family N-acetyltransferase, partial [Rhodoblastus sp.]
RTLALARGFLRGLAGENRCEIAWLDVAGAPVAAIVLVYSGNMAFIWKIAFDEQFAAYSPGAQLIVDLTKSLLADPNFTIADSCAAFGAQNIETIWNGRRRITDMLVGSPGLPFLLVGEMEAAKRNLRAGVKCAYGKAKGLMRR